MARGHHDAWLQEIEAIFQHVSATGTFARVVHDNSHTEDMAPVQLCPSGPSCGHHNTVECPTAMSSPSSFTSASTLPSGRKLQAASVGCQGRLPQHVVDSPVFRGSFVGISQSEHSYSRRIVQNVEWGRGMIHRSLYSIANISGPFAGHAGNRVVQVPYEASCITWEMR